MFKPISAKHLIAFLAGFVLALVIGLAALAALSGYDGFGGARAGPYRPYRQAIDPVTRRRLLGATVRIRLYAPVLRDGAMVALPGGVLQDTSNGLGTLVRVADEHYIVTHDHWETPFDQLSHVEFFTADQQWLAVLTRTDFLQAIRYRDAGTLILSAPPALAPLEPVELSGEFVTIGAQLAAVYRDPDTDILAVIPVVVDATMTTSGRPCWQLRSLNGVALDHGNSGAGVFLDGQLAGNVWTAIRLTVSIPWGDGVYVQKFNSVLGTAARMPREALPALGLGSGRG